jgi:DNA modification methylase
MDHKARRFLERNNDASQQDYDAFLAAKACVAIPDGLDMQEIQVSDMLKPHQDAITRWAVSGGRRAIFASFGLGKTFIQLEIARCIAAFTGGRFLIVAPLGVRHEFAVDALKLGIGLKFVRSLDECGDTGVYLTNYETIRDGKIDPKKFAGASLDEASVLRSFGGTKTFREFMRVFEGMRYKFVATATPSPNEYIELLAYAAFLDVMDVGEAKTRFFKRDSTKADVLTIHPHKEREFWLWVSSWAIFVQRPSDLGYSDDGYILPDLDIHWHEVETDHSNAGEERDGQARMFKNAAFGIVDSSREKRDSLPQRIAKMMELRALDPDAHRIIWHDLEREREAIETAIPDVLSVFGTQDLKTREEIIAGFSEGSVRELATKPVLCGSGCNFQRHCNWAIFLGIGFKFNDFIQAVHRLQRFLQTKPVRVDLIYTSAEREVRKSLERKWKQHKELCDNMTQIIREFGLSHQAMAAAMARSTGVKRVEVSGEGWTLALNDTVLETRAMETNSVHLVLTSIPFGNQYEYSPSYNDFGHTDTPAHFFQQMDYLTPELLRVLKPGRIAAIHVKDRITPGGINGLGFQTAYPFHCDTIMHYTKHGFAYLGMKTIVTDVVRENNQTYRLGWSEQCKDGTKMGVGMPEYLLLFRKPPSDSSNAYADEPVLKSKPDCVCSHKELEGEPGECPTCGFVFSDTTGNAPKVIPFERNLPTSLPVRKGHYSRARWQTDAHGFTRSSGNTQLTPEHLKGLDHGEIFRLFRDYYTTNVYDYENHVRIGEYLEATGILPVTFMLLQPPSWSDEVWSDVTRMLGMNTMQAAAGKEGHLCPMQFDIADRTITQHTNHGELVYDPFGGLGTVPYRAVLLGRQGRSAELNPGYFWDSVQYLKAAETKVNMPSLFDLTGDAQ